MALSDKKKTKARKRRVSGPWKVPQIKPSGPKLPKIISGAPSFQPTKADDRGYAGGGRARSGIGGSRGGIGPKVIPRPKGKPLIKGMIKTPEFKPTKADDRGYAGGGTLDSMRKKIIGIKKDRGLTAKSGARKGMTKKKATGRGGR